MPYTKSCNTSEKIGLYIPADKQPEVPGTTQGSFTYSKFFNSTDLLVLSEFYSILMNKLLLMYRLCIF